MSYQDDNQTAKRQLVERGFMTVAEVANLTTGQLMAAYRSANEARTKIRLEAGLTPALKR